MDETKELESRKERIEWIDFAKGITILLTIIGHSVNRNIEGCVVRGIIYSFHMPLFFILSCMTFQLSKTLDEFKKKSAKAAKHLLIPVLIVFFILIFFECRKHTWLILDAGFWKSKIYSLIYSSAGTDIFFNGSKVELIGIPWFLVALFFGRTIFDYLHLKLNDNGILLITSSIVGMIGILWGKIQVMPFSLDIALSVMPFLYYGYRHKNLDVTTKPFLKMIIWGGIWIITLYIAFPNANNKTYLELADRRYMLFPLCYLTAIAGTMCICQFSVICCRLRRFVMPITYIGKNTLYLLCIHALDTKWYKLWGTDYGYNPYMLVKRLVADIAIFAFVMLGITIVRKLFKKVAKVMKV